MRKGTYILACTALLGAILACGLPSEEQVNAVVTALAQTASAQTQTAAALTAQAPGVPSATPEPSATNTVPPTVCTPIVTANSNANVRSGDSTEYDPPVGYLPTGGTAPLAGRNAANTWWYIDFPSGPGGHGWIAMSLTTASCVPAVVAVVVPPPLPPTLTPVPVVFSVTHVGFNLSTFNDGSYHDCPVVTAHIKTNAAGTVKYHWTRSDGASSPMETLVFGSAGTQDVEQRWYLGSVWAGTTHWIGIYIDTPNGEDFGHKEFDIACAP